MALLLCEVGSWGVELTARGASDTSRTRCPRSSSSSGMQASRRTGGRADTAAGEEERGSLIELLHLPMDGLLDGKDRAGNLELAYFKDLVSTALRRTLFCRPVEALRACLSLSIPLYCTSPCMFLGCSPPLSPSRASPPVASDMTLICCMNLLFPSFPRTA